MSNFKPGDKVLIEAQILTGPDDQGHFRCHPGDSEHYIWVAPAAFRPWSERPYTDPELVAGMVVADGTGRRWHYLPRGKGDENPFWPEVSLAPGRRQRSDLPEQIRVVFDPQES